ncbi:hypothetical protein CJU90_2193 [Yarrowia sp. C11]|nr:hypothetical protein CKK34_6220 [Yarrowia sp. E02]KAG5372116.1 hypothetical protein CJU90_2193 [Yarrowia sp. C11]
MKALDPDTTTYAAVLESLQTYLAVFIHNIAYYFNVYPADAFQQVRQYNTAVWLCRAPIVNEYIDEASQKCVDLLKEGKCSAMAISIHDTAAKHVASIPIKFSLPVVPESDQTVPVTDAPTLIEDLQIEFNAFFTRLANYGPNFNPSNLEHTFKIQCELEGSHAMEDWISSRAPSSKRLPGLEDTVVRKIETGPIEVVSWLEYV